MIYFDFPLRQELIKNTDQMHPDRKSLERALDEMQVGLPLCFLKQKLNRTLQCNVLNSYSNN